MFVVLGREFGEDAARCQDVAVVVEGVEGVSERGLEGPAGGDEGGVEGAEGAEVGV